MADTAVGDNDNAAEAFTVASSGEYLRYASRIGDVRDVEQILGRYKGDSNELARFLPAVVGAADSISGNKALHFCAANGHLDILHVLLRNGADINVTNLSGSTPLHYAALTGQLEIVKELIRQNAQAVVENKYEKTALDEARSAKHSDIAEFLMGHVEKKSELPDLDKRGDDDSREPDLEATEEGQEK
ncbi:unnamed protein product [Chondrus crispus]|uniref:Uncharacterized protein n=1 Tax=Chondrus crispus TaxID=2769 RepID=R7QQ31_CHOCR|nr:unnamed protein product [Chondrus crispus]CDF39470.1 unnamed protein product [Chondrus crispus]|eukprot:XP_005719381.1 unnamed protein product [Chondrus crispus]